MRSESQPNGSASLGDWEVGTEVEVALPGGKTGGAVRVGDTVRRATGPWSPAIHDLLTFLREAGLWGVPQLLGTDRRGREVLRWIPGEALDPEDAPSDRLLAEGAGWLSAYHRVVFDFRPRGPVAWRGGSRELAEHEIICHHDPAPYNWITADGHFQAMIDWDMAAPGEPIDDVAFLAWNAVPLKRPITASDAAARLGVIARAYGGVTEDEILDRVPSRIRRATDRIAAGQRAGDPGMLTLGEAGEPAATLAALAEFERSTDAIRTALSAAP